MRHRKDENEGAREEDGLAHFIKYNNAVPIVLGILFLSTTAAYAASPEARQAVYSSTSEVRATDNSYIASANLDTYPFSVRVTSIMEDEDHYYVAYDFDTIDLIDYVWQDAVKKGTLTIFKVQLRGGDLKTYAEAEFAQLQRSESQRLKETQAYEKRSGVSQKRVATAYAGLVGKFIRPNEKTLPFYQPPPGAQNKNDPLALKNPKPLVTWDENAIVKEPKEPKPPVVTPPGGGGEPPPPTDACPDIEGVQADASACPGAPVDACPDMEGVQADPAECVAPPAEELPPAEEPQPEPEPAPVAPPPGA